MQGCRPGASYDLGAAPGATVERGALTGPLTAHFAGSVARVAYTVGMWQTPRRRDRSAPPLATKAGTRGASPRHKSKLPHSSDGRAVMLKNWRAWPKDQWRACAGRSAPTGDAASASRPEIMEEKDAQVPDHPPVHDGRRRSPDGLPAHMFGGSAPSSVCRRAAASTTRSRWPRLRARAPQCTSAQAPTRTAA